MAPHAPQVRLLFGPPQTNPVLQVSPPPPDAGQQAWPAPPHGSQVAPPAAPPAPPAPECVTQVLPAWQMSPAQQAPPGAPHAIHVRGELPGGFAQARPALQVLLLQHTWLEPPQAAHTPGVVVVRPEQIRFAPHAVAAEAEQQGCPEPPQAVHMLLSHAPPG
ncbi:MAG TPA: hypothetical protein VIU64_16760 [Polyangia bacterium]